LGVQLGLYFVGGGVSFGITSGRMGSVFYMGRCGLSLLGVLVFWLEPIFLGLGDQPHSGLVFLWLDKEFLGVNTLNFEYFMLDL
jgi:hypothetical protein